MSWLGMNFDLKKKGSQGAIISQGCTEHKSEIRSDVHPSTEYSGLCTPHVRLVLVAIPKPLDSSRVQEVKKRPPGKLNSAQATVTI